MLLEIFLFTMSHRSMNWSRSLCVLGTRAVGVEAVLVTGMCLPGMEGGNEFSVLCTGCAFAPEAALHIALSSLHHDPLALRFRLKSAASAEGLTPYSSICIGRRRKVVGSCCPPHRCPGTAMKTALGQGASW